MQGELIVLLPYEITLFSNNSKYHNQILLVLLPYEITLFSNENLTDYIDTSVLLPYEITLFSNSSYPAQMLMWFYYLMKLHYSQT